MNLSIVDVGSPANASLDPLRRMIVRLAERCRLDLADKPAVRRFLDGDFSRCEAPEWDTNSCGDLHSMITLLFRIEASSSEDLGIDGLHRLWQQHNALLASCDGARETFQGGLQFGLSPA